MAKYIIKRLAISIVSILVIIVVLFSLMRLMPGTPFNDEKLTNQQKEILYEAYGLDKPIPLQLVNYMGNMLHGDFGVSYSLAPNIPVTQLLAEVAPISMGIGLRASFLGILLGLLVGILGAYYQGRFPDILCTLVIVIGVSFPSYLFAIFLSYNLGYRLRWLPLFYDTQSPVISSIMPTMSMAIGITAIIARFARESVKEALNSEYVLFAKSKGVSKGNLIFRYALRNAMVSILTIIGPIVVAEMSGSVICENIFGLPGMGALMTKAISANDYNVVFAIALLFSIIFIVMNFIMDLLYCVVDPRIRLS